MSEVQPAAPGKGEATQMLEFHHQPVQPQQSGETAKDPPMPWWLRADTSAVQKDSGSPRSVLPPLSAPPTATHSRLNPQARGAPRGRAASVGNALQVLRLRSHRAGADESASRGLETLQSSQDTGQSEKEGVTRGNKTHLLLDTDGERKALLLLSQLQDHHSRLSESMEQHVQDYRSQERQREGRLEEMEKEVDALNDTVHELENQVQSQQQHIVDLQAALLGTVGRPSVAGQDWAEQKDGIGEQRDVPAQGKGGGETELEKALLHLATGAAALLQVNATKEALVPRADVRASIMSSASSADLVMADRLIEANGAREIFEDVEKGQMHTALQAAYVSLQSALDLVQSKAGLSEAPSEAELTQQHVSISPSERGLVDRDLQETGSSKVYAPRRVSVTYTGASFQAGPRHHLQPTASASDPVDSIGSLEMGGGSFSSSGRALNQKVVTGVKKKFFNDIHSTSFTKKLSHQLSEAQLENEDILAGMSKKERKALRRAQHEEFKDSVRDNSFQEWHWSPNSENAYGAFIHTAMHETFLQSFRKCGAALLICSSIQFAFAWELWYSMPVLESEMSGFCRNPGFLQISATCVFLLIMTGNIPQMTRAMLIVLFADDHIFDGRHHKLEHSSIERFFIFLFGVVSEYVTWTCVLCAGVYWILSAPDVNNVIRSTVSIAFVTNIDEMIYATITPEPIRKGLVSTKYLLRYGRIGCGLKEKQLFWICYKYAAYFHLPAIFCLPFLFVVVMRSKAGENLWTGCWRFHQPIADEFWDNFVSQCPFC